MKKALDCRLFAGVVIGVGLACVFGGNVVVKEGTIETDVLKMTGCTASGAKAVALGGNTEASAQYTTALGYCTDANANYATAMGGNTSADGQWSTAMGWYSKASGLVSLAAGYKAEATANYSTAFGRYSTNSVAESFTVGFGTSSDYDVDFRVEDGKVTIGHYTAEDPNTYYGDLVVGNNIDCNDITEHSSFYDRDKYDKALDYATDSSQTFRVSAQGEKEYDHEADPPFLKKWVTVKDYDRYSDEQVWNAELQDFETIRTYETHQELRSSLGMKVAWLRQCVFELKGENDLLRAELAQIKQHIGIE